MALSMQQRPGSLPRPILSNGGELLIHHPATDQATDSSCGAIIIHHLLGSNASCCSRVFLSEGNQQYSRGSYGRIKAEDYEDDEDEEEDEGSESDEDDYEGEDEEDNDGRPYRKQQRRASYGQHGRDTDPMHDDGRLYSPNGRGAVRG